MTIPDEAVQAAEEAVYARHERGFLMKPLVDPIDMRAAITAALPFLQGVKVGATDIGNPITLVYTNYRGETSERTITPIKPWFGSTEWHPEPQWLLTAFDHEKQANRDFALKDFGYPAPSPRAQALEEAAPFAPAMVPAKMLLEAKSIQDLLFILGGCDEENPYHDGILWVGTMPDEDGDRYGLHVYSNEYPEEGSITLATFEPAALSSKTAVERWNTRRAAPVEGLERFSLAAWSEEPTHHSYVEPDPVGEYVRYDQAEAIIAAERNRSEVAEYKLDQAVNTVQPMIIQRAERAEADNAAKVAEKEAFAEEIKEAAYEAWPEANEVGSDAPQIIRQLSQERDKLEDKLAATRAENARLIKINEAHCQTVNTLTIDGARLDGIIRDLKADNAALTARVKEYVDARDACERATLSNGGFGQPRTLKHNDPIVLRYREARAALEEKP